MSTSDDATYNKHFAEEYARIRARRDVEQLLRRQDRGAPPSLNLQSGPQVRSRPRPPFLIEEVMPVAALFQVFGASGQHKSFVMLDMALSIANGLPWLGKSVTRTGLVALILGEGGADAGERVAAWLDAHPGATDDNVFYSVEEGLDLLDEQDVATIIEDLILHRDALRHDRDDYDLNWQLVVFDTQADHMTSGDEDKAAVFSQAKRSLQKIMQATGAATGTVHHTGHDESRARGSSRQRQSLDVVLQIRSETVINVKQKFGPLFSNIKFALDQRLGSLVVRLPTQDELLQSGLNKAAAELADVRKLLAYLNDPANTRHGQEFVSQEIGVRKDRVAGLSQRAKDEGWLDYVPPAKGTLRPATYSVTEAGRAWLAEPESAE